MVKGNAEIPKEAFQDFCVKWEHLKFVNRGGEYFEELKDQ